MKKSLKNLTFSALFIALGLVLPLLTGQLQQIGNMLLPMHIPVLLCGLICGWQYGAAVGFILPFLRTLLFTMPPLYPTAVAMAFELAAYGFIAGFMFSHARWQCIRSLYRCLIVAIIGGRIVWGLAMTVLLGVGENGFTLAAFFAGAFVNSVAGIVLQLILVPAIMLALDRTHLVPFKKKANEVTDNAKG